MWAAFADRAGATVALVLAGADAALADDNGADAAAHALSNGHAALAEALSKSRRDGGALADSLFVLLAAILIDAYVGAPLWSRGWRWQPLVAVERVARGCVAPPRPAPGRGRRALRVRGAVAVGALAAAAAAAGAGLEAAANAWPVFWTAVLFVLVGMVDQRGKAPTRRIVLGRALAVHDDAEADAALARLSARDPRPSRQPRHGAGRRRGVDAPPGPALDRAGPLRRLRRGVAAVAVYWTVDRLAAAGGGAFGAPARGLGAPARGLRRAACWLPDRLAGLALAAAAILWGGAANAAVVAGGLRRAAGGDWPPAAAAAALGLALGGPRRYADRLLTRPWIGVGRPQVGPNDIAVARDLHGLAVAIMALAIAVACAVRLFQGGA